jgi:hypothetical protein
MPAFLRIFHERFVLLFVHINHIQRAGVFTSPASGAEFLVDDWRHKKLLFQTDFGDLPQSIDRDETLNPKHEIRNSKQIQIPNVSMIKMRT